MDGSLNSLSFIDIQHSISIYKLYYLKFLSLFLSNAFAKYFFNCIYSSHCYLSYYDTCYNIFIVIYRIFQKMIKKSLIKGMQVLCTSWKKLIHIYIIIEAIIKTIILNLVNIIFNIHVNTNFCLVKIRCYLHKNFKVEKYLYFLK